MKFGPDRHSPSSVIATRPISKSFDEENSSAVPAMNRWSLSTPVAKSPLPYTSVMNFFCQVNISAQAGSDERAGWPAASSQLAPNMCPKLSVVLPQQLYPSHGTNPATLIEPS